MLRVTAKNTAYKLKGKKGGKECGIFSVKVRWLTKQHLQRLNVASSKPCEMQSTASAVLARQPCHLIPPPEFRSVTLRPTLSSSLPFTSYFYGSFANIRFGLAVNSAFIEQKGCHMFIWRYFFVHIRYRILIHKILN
jgi:hypothetical protein